MEIIRTKVAKLMLIVLSLYNYLRISFAEQRFFTAQRGYRSDESILETALVATVTHCARICVNNVDCNVYNIGMVTAGAAGDAGLTCEIIRSDSTDDASLWTQQAGWDMYTASKQAKTSFDQH